MNTTTKEISFDEMLLNDCFALESEEMTFDTFQVPITLHDAVKSDSKIVRGQKHHKSRLTEEEVHQIFNLKSLGLSQSWIANHYGVSDSTIYCILTRKTWRHLKIMK